MNIFRILLISVSLIAFNSARAVMLSAENEGQVLIFPYVSALGGNDTLISISSDGAAKALKVAFRDLGGELALSFNLYLGERNTWAAALTEVDGQVHLEIGSPNCTLPSLGGAGTSVAVPITSGYLEVFEMGTIDDGDIRDAVDTQDCASLVGLWADGGSWSADPSFGMSPPEGRLRGVATLINGQHGTMYRFVAKALADFSDIQQHSAPEATLPDLTSAHDEGTDGGQTSSRVCSATGCIEDTWASPVDAVAAALMAFELSGEYANESAIGAEAEVVLTRPLQHIIRQTGVGLNIHNREGEYIPASGPCPPLLACRPRAYQGGTFQSVYLLSFNDSVEDEGSVLPLNILGDDHVAFFPSDQNPEIPAEGTFDILLGANESTIRSLAGNAYYGRAAVGVILQRYSNGYLEDEMGQRVLANYGSALELRRTVRIEP